METIKILPYGFKVTTKGGVTGIITGTTIRKKTVSYEFCWFDGGERRQDWLYEEELEFKEISKKQIVGFGKPE